MPPKVLRRRDPTFLRLACIAALGGVGAVATSIVATMSTAHDGHPTSTYFFFSLWGLAALAGAAANIATYFQSGDPPEKPPRGGKRIAQLHVIEGRPQGAAIEAPERKAA